MAERGEEPEAEGLGDAGADAVSPAAALAIGVRKGRRLQQPDPEFDAFLRKQSRLVDLQTEHLHEQRQVILLRLRLGAWKDRASLALQTLTVLAALAIAAAIAVMAWQAHDDHGLVVQPFSVPPDLAQRGLTGEVVAARLIDRLSELQTQTKSARPASSYANNWGDDIKVEIPETGVSIGELNRWLRKELGHETTISGELYRTPSGLAVAARAGIAPASLHAGAEADLDELVRHAAEDVYAATQPYRYAIFLAQSGQGDQARAVLERLAQTGDPTDRMWAYVGLATSLRYAGDDAGSIRAASSSIAVEPKFGLAYHDRAQSLANIGHDEAALADDVRADELNRRDGARYLSQDTLANALIAFDGQRAAAVGGFDQGAADFRSLLRLSNSGDPTDALNTLADYQALAHDVTGARRAEAQLPPGPSTARKQMEAQEQRLIGDADADQALENWPALWRVYAGADQSPTPAPVRQSLTTHVAPEAALARAEMGDIAGAKALIATTPTDCYLCLRDRARIAALAHDWVDADRWFAEAVRQGPSLPFAHAEWGRALLDKGEPDRAIAELTLAREKGPHFADPAEVWGEALMAKRDYAGAISKFAEADTDAPRWGRNHLMWGEALMLSGRYKEARAQFQAANGLDLSTPDRAALNVLLARTASGPLHVAP